MPNNWPSEAEAMRVSNIRPDFKAGKLLAAGMKTDVLVMFAKAIPKIDRSVRAINQRAIQTIGDKAKANLRSSILRPNETGINEYPAFGKKPAGGNRGRQTGNFTFGQGGAFVGRVGNTARPTKGMNTIAFGFPDIAVADQRTKGIWRVLEFGLGNRRGKAQPGTGGSSLGQSLAGRFGSEGPAMLPKKFGFTTPTPSTAQMVIVKGPAVSSGAEYVQLFKTKQRRKNASKKRRVNPQGQFAKFFLTRAIEDTIPEVVKGYTQVPTEAFRKR